MATINKLFKTDDNEDEIFNWLQENKDHKTFSNNLNRFLNLLLDNEDIDLIEEVFDTFKVNTKKTSDKQLGVLLIRYHCIAENPKIALEIYDKLGKKNRRKRHLTIIIQTLLDMRDDDFAYNIYEGFLVDDYPIDVEDLVMFFDTDFSDLVFESAIGLDILFPHDLVKKKDQKAPSKDLKKFKLSKKEKDKLLDSIKKQFQKKKKVELYNNFIKQLTKKDVIIDGANVLFYGDRAITPDSYVRLNKSIEELEKMGKSVLVVLHERHFSVKKYKWKNDKDVAKRIIDGWDLNKFYKTPTTFNDDWYAIIAAIVNDSYIVTNDNFNDHVFGAFEVLKNGKNVFRRWKQEYGIFYQFKNRNKVIEFDFPKEYSEEIQEIEDVIHVPLTNGKWLLF